MALIREADRRVDHHVLTFNDPRTTGLVGAPGDLCVYVDPTTGRAYPMVKHDAAWEPVFSGTEDGPAGVITADLADLAVTAAKLAADAVITAKILDLNVTTGKLADLGVTAAKLAANAATTAKIADANVTIAKLEAALVAAIPGAPTLTVAAQAGVDRVATIQLKNIAGVAIGAAASARVWISDVAGGAPTAVAPAGGVAITAGVSMLALVASKVFDAVSTAAGVITVTLTSVVGATWYVNVAIGAYVASIAVTIV